MKLENLLFILLYLFYYNRLLFIVFLGCPRIRVLFFLCRSRTGYSTPIRTGTRTRTRTGSTFCSIFFLSLFFSLRNQNTENRKQIITQHLAIDLSSLSFPFLSSKHFRSVFDPSIFVPFFSTSTRFPSLPRVAVLFNFSYRHIFHFFLY